MECLKVQEQLIEYVEGTLSQNDEESVEEHLQSCESCQKELENTREFLRTLSSNVPKKPSDQLRRNFEHVLAKEKELQQTKVVSLNTTNNWKFFLKIAASIALLVSAFLLGKYERTSSDQNIVLNEKKLRSENEKQLLALLESTSASKRIQALNYSESFETTDTRIVQAFINRLFFDKNTNVRLAAVEALSKFTDLEMVKSAFIKSLETEQDPTIQIELIHILTNIQEKRALEPMKKLLNEEQTPIYVKQELQYNIQNLL